MKDRALLPDKFIARFQLLKGRTTRASVMIDTL